MSQSSSAALVFVLITSIKKIKLFSPEIDVLNSKVAADFFSFKNELETKAQNNFISII